MDSLLEKSEAAMLEFLEMATGRKVLVSVHKIVGRASVHSNRYDFLNQE